MAPIASPSSLETWPTRPFLVGRRPCRNYSVCETDQTLEKAVHQAIQSFGRIDSLVINHGSLDPVKKVSESSAEEWRKAFDINVFSAVGLIQAALPSLRATKGRIVLTSSGAAQSAYQGWGAYGAGKAVLNHLAMTLSVEEPDVTTISIRPGVVDTEMQRGKFTSPPLRSMY
jgi:NAD(P)-dependent dehydrogenase (short-subunit alcohol dehydrogenase family)